MLHLREQTNETNNKTQVVSCEYPLPHQEQQTRAAATLRHPTPNTQHPTQLTVGGCIAEIGQRQ